MPYNLRNRFVIATSTRALFDLSRENEIFEKRGLEAYEDCQKKHEDTPWSPGVAFPLIRTMLALNGYLPENRGVEVIVVSRNSPAIALRFQRSVRHYNLPISRYVFTSGESVAKYLEELEVNLFLSANVDDVKDAHKSGVASGLIWGLPLKGLGDSALTEIRIAFDGDAVLFSEESERIYQDKGVDAFHQNEKEKADEPLEPGPFANVLKALAYVQKHLKLGGPRIVLGLVTARNAPSDERVIKTLREWGVRMDTTMFLGGIDKSGPLMKFQPHIFFDDQVVHCSSASTRVPTAQVLSSIYEQGDSVSPKCPNCSQIMVRKTARRGRNRGKPFWGCSEFPKCNGSISIP